jgi:acyl-CoA dehydrogenase
MRLSSNRNVDSYVLNGQKRWTSGAGDPRCAVYIVLGKTDLEHVDKYKQQSILSVLWKGYRGKCYNSETDEYH